MMMMNLLIRFGGESPHKTNKNLCHELGLLLQQSSKHLHLLASILLLLLLFHDVDLPDLALFHDVAPHDRAQTASYKIQTGYDPGLLAD